jgi:hypothetical protein
MPWMRRQAAGWAQQHHAAGGPIDVAGLGRIAESIYA